jgi:hypothetical protein
LGVSRCRTVAADSSRGRRLGGDFFGPELSTKIYLGVEGVDMRKGFNGLYGLVQF